jgi:hypothetical protein
MRGGPIQARAHRLPSALITAEANEDGDIVGMRVGVLEVGRIALREVTVSDSALKLRIARRFCGYASLLGFPIENRWKPFKRDFVLRR